MPRLGQITPKGETMNLTSENTTAANGMQVQSTVRLFIERIGVEKLPFRVQASVNHVGLYTSHHATEAEAKETRKRMHAAYMEVHSTPA